MKTVQDVRDRIIESVAMFSSYNVNCSVGDYKTHTIEISIYKAGTNVRDRTARTRLSCKFPMVSKISRGNVPTATQSLTAFSNGSGIIYLNYLPNITDGLEVSVSKFKRSIGAFLESVALSNARKGIGADVARSKAQELRKRADGIEQAANVATASFDDDDDIKEW